MPCLFATRRDALENRDGDEYVLRVYVAPLVFL